MQRHLGGHGPLYQLIEISSDDSLILKRKTWMELNNIKSRDFLHPLVKH